MNKEDDIKQHNFDIYHLARAFTRRERSSLFSITNNGIWRAHELFGEKAHVKKATAFASLSKLPSTYAQDE